MAACKWGNEEELCFNLQKLYGGFGYQRYKMGKFEEYSLYLDNKNFLRSPQVITFTDAGGKLMALKPDVTLSIVKNANLKEGGRQKVYYKESVYRPDKTTGEFREISQIGLEFLGGIDAAATAEVLYLAARSLAEIDDNYILDVSHPGIAAGIIEKYGAASHAAEIYAFMASKNTHDLKRFCEEKGLDASLADKLGLLVSCGGDFAAALDAAEKAVDGAPIKALVTLRRAYEALSALGVADKTRLDFSIVGDADYYKGIMFLGYVGGSPYAVLSGGRYDKLAGKYGCDSGIGFALYLDQLSFYGGGNSGGYDAVVLYDDNTNPADVVKTVERYADSGKTAVAAKTLPLGADGEIVDLRRDKNA